MQPRHTTHWLRLRPQGTLPQATQQQQRFRYCQPKQNFAGVHARKHLPVKKRTHTRTHASICHKTQHVERRNRTEIRLTPEFTPKSTNGPLGALPRFLLLHTATIATGRTSTTSTTTLPPPLLPAPRSLAEPPREPSCHSFQKENQRGIRRENRQQRSSEPFRERCKLQPGLEDRGEAGRSHENGGVRGEGDEPHRSVFPERLHERVAGVVRRERVDLYFFYVLVVRAGAGRRR